MYNQIAKVAVENAAYSFDDAFDYAIPAELQGKVQPGVRVLVPFGNGSKKTGICVCFAAEKRRKKTQSDCRSFRRSTAFE